MARRTPPVEQQTVEAKVSSSAVIKMRLIDFDTNSEKLEEQHKQWMQSIRMRLLRLANFKIQLHGFASKQGSPSRNKTLSMQRMKSVLSYLQQIDNRVMSSSQMLEELGENVSTGSEHDNQSTAVWRAVEVHIFDGNPPPPDPGKEVKPDVVPLPGGERHKEWAIATPGGFTVAEIVGLQFNIIIIKTSSFLTMGEEKRGYLHVAGGLGASAGFKDLSKLGKVLQTILTGASFSSVSFTRLTAAFPVTWSEVEKSIVTTVGDTEGFAANSRFLFNTIVTHHGPHGTPVATGETIFDFMSISAGIGAGVFGGTGSLKRFSLLDSL